MLRRPTDDTIRLSSAFGVAWAILFVALAVIQAVEVVAWTTDVFLGLVGAVAALVPFRSPRNVRSTAEPN